MGNTASCTPSAISSNSVVKVISYNESVRIYRGPVRAAELMMENMGQFVCEFTTLKVGHKVTGLSADEELKCRKTYFLLPTEILYCFLTWDQFNFLKHKYYSSKGILNDAGLCFGKRFSFLGNFCVITKAQAQQIGDDEEGEHLIGLTTKSYSRQGSWRPALETIFETPPRVI